ncbi:MAG: ZIP family metal transporter [Pseudonocardiaceae bacterium]
MTTALGFAAGASLPLLAGALVGVFWCPPRRLIAVALAFAAGALISAVSFELFQESYNAGGALRAGLGFAAGATVFVVTDALLDRVTAANPTGFALLAGVTLDGVPENVALGVSLNAAGSLALLVAVFASNFPEALAGAVSMQEQGRARGAVVALWGGATLLLGVAVVVGPEPVRVQDRDVGQRQRGGQCPEQRASATPASATVSAHLSRVNAAAALIQSSPGSASGLRVCLHQRTGYPAVGTDFAPTRSLPAPQPQEDPAWSPQLASLIVAATQSGNFTRLDRPSSPIRRNILSENTAQNGKKSQFDTKFLTQKCS